MKIFETIVEKTIKSSKTIVGLATDIISIAQEIKTIKEAITNVSKVVQFQQAAINEIYDAINAEQASLKKIEFNSYDKKSSKKEKPN